MTQTASIMAWMQQGFSITPLEAQARFGCMRLASRIDELRSKGVSVVTTIVKRNGKRYASYALGKREFPIVT